MSYKRGLRQWCKRHDIDHRAYADSELLKMRLEMRHKDYGM